MLEIVSNTCDDQKPTAKGHGIVCTYTFVLICTETTEQTKVLTFNLSPIHNSECHSFSFVRTYF